MDRNSDKAKAGRKMLELLKIAGPEAYAEGVNELMSGLVNLSVESTVETLEVLELVDDPSDVQMSVSLKIPNAPSSVHGALGNPAHNIGLKITALKAFLDEVGVPIIELIDPVKVADHGQGFAADLRAVIAHLTALDSAITHVETQRWAAEPETKH